MREKKHLWIFVRWANDFKFNEKISAKSENQSEI